MKKLKWTQTAWNKSLMPAANVAVPFLGIAVGAKTKKPPAAQAITNSL